MTKSSKIPSSEELSRRLEWFREYAARLDTQPTGLPTPLPVLWVQDPW